MKLSRQQWRLMMLILIFLINGFAKAHNLAKAFKLQNGDLLFVDLNCGQFCDSIDSVTYGYSDTYVSHVAMVINSESGIVIEAVSKGVELTSLATFLNRSLDQNHHPRVMVGRLLPQYRFLIPSASSYAKLQLGKPYNASFWPGKEQSFYCSELIDYSFKAANHNQGLFAKYPMNFTNGKNSQILPLWQDYYQSLHTPVPQGILGTNPGEMSRESMVKIIYYYGQLRKHH